MRFATRGGRLALLLLSTALATPASAQDYPPSTDAAALSAWLEKTTNITPSTVVSVTPELVVAIVGKTTDDLREKAYHLSWWLLFAMLGAIGAVSLATPFLDVEYARRWFTWPNVLFTAPVPIAVAAVTALLLQSLARRQDYKPFVLSLVLFALSYAGLGISMYPYIVPRSITIWQAAAPESSQIFMLVGVSILIPIILIYTGWAYWVFRGKVDPQSGYH